MSMIFMLAREPLDVIYVNLWAIIISLLNLVILFLFLKKFLFRPVTRVMAERRARVDAILTDAEAAREAAEADKTAYAERLGQAEADAAEVIRRATATATRESDAILATAREHAAAMKRQAEADIAQERKKAVNELKGEISAISLSIAEQVVAREVKPDDHHAMIDAFIRDVGEASDDA